MKYRCGNLQCFHGAFSSEEKAKRKKDQRIVRRYIRGSRRYIVLTPKK